MQFLTVLWVSIGAILVVLLSLLIYNVVKILQSDEEDDAELQSALLRQQRWIGDDGVIGSFLKWLFVLIFTGLLVTLIRKASSVAKVVEVELGGISKKLNEKEKSLNKSIMTYINNYRYKDSFKNRKVDRRMSTGTNEVRTNNVSESRRKSEPFRNVSMNSRDFAFKGIEGFEQKDVPVLESIRNDAVKKFSGIYPGLAKIYNAGTFNPADVVPITEDISNLIVALASIGPVVNEKIIEGLSVLQSCANV